MSIDDTASKPKRPFGRSLGDFTNLSEAEKKLIACAARGEECRLGESVPETSTADNLIRPDLIRFLALGGDETAPVHEKGVTIIAAHIGPAPLDFTGIQMTGNLRLFNCHLASPLIFQDTRGTSITLDNSFFPGLIADRLKLVGDLFLRRVFSEGYVILNGSEIEGDLNCIEGRFENPRGTAITCDRAKIGGSIYFANDFRATNEINLNNVTIGGDLVCRGGHFETSEGWAISCCGAKIGGSVLLTNGFQANGEVSFLHAEIGGDLCCYAGRFDNSLDVSLNCSEAKIDGNVLLTGAFRANGEVSFLNAEIGGDLSCRSGRFENRQGQALSCYGAKIKGSVLFADDFHSTGQVCLTDVVIGSYLLCFAGQFENSGGEALTCNRAKIGETLYFGQDFRADGGVSLAHVSVATLKDNIYDWPDGSFDLYGFSYERIVSSSRLDAKQLIAWIERKSSVISDPGSLALQPWMHLAKVLREQGYFREAREVDIARENRLQATWLHCFYGWSSGYGHRPWRIVIVAFFVWALSAILYDQEANNGHFAPAIALTDKSLGMKCLIEQGKEPVNWTRCNELLVNYPRFNAWAYSLDLILPVVQLGEFTRWTHVWQGNWLSFSGFIQILIYFEKIFGWIAALTLAAIAAGLVKRKDG